MIETIVRSMMEAWNAADGEAFAEPFAEDADFVTVFGLHARGRSNIAVNHDIIFKGIYAGSCIQYEVEQTRPLGDGVMLAHLRAHLHVPAGKMAGDHYATPSLVLTRRGECWEIAALHNTWVTPPPGS